MLTGSIDNGSGYIIMFLVHFHVRVRVRRRSDFCFSHQDRLCLPLNLEQRNIGLENALHDTAVTLTQSHGCGTD